MAETREQCTLMYRNLIEMMNGTRRRHPSESVVILRELWKTEQCDLIASDLSNFRQVIKTDIGEKTLNRIIDYKTTDIDRQRVTATMARYRIHTINTLVHTLPLSNYIYYNALFFLRR